LIVTGGASGSGNGVVAYSVEANPGAARTGTITIAGQTFTVSQAAPPPPPPPPPCTFSIAPGSETVAAAGGSGTVMVTASAPACTWTATSNASDWLAVTSGASGTGSGAVTYSVSPNLLTTDRTGTISVAGQTFTVVQPHP
jgi:alkanesulfonate monooxygenase SsuD/methylene tetrahydromethanopterin reductase-like flavin-dependent oxidoreductase (luciferase family)